MQNLTIAVVGKSGSGKSTLCNVLLQDKYFTVGAGARTQTTQSSSCTRQVHGMNLTVIDTPDAMVLNDPKVIDREAKDFINLCGDGLHAFILVVQCGRFTKESRDAVESMAAMFGECIYDFITIVFTKADNYDSYDEFMRSIENSRRENPDAAFVLNKCNNRLTFIDNGRRCDQERQLQQSQTILRVVDEMVKQRNTKYTRAMFEQAQVTLQQMMQEAQSQPNENEQMEQIVAFLQREKDELQMAMHRSSDQAQRTPQEQQLQQRSNAAAFEADEIERMRETIERLELEINETKLELERKRSSRNYRLQCWLL